MTTPNIDVVISTLLVLFMMAFLGGIIGLAISSFSKKNISAIICATIFTISALFFSKPVVGWDSENEKDIPVKISKIMPCHYGYKFLTDSIKKYKVYNRKRSSFDKSLVKVYIEAPTEEKPDNESRGEHATKQSVQEAPNKEDLPNPFVNLKKFLFNTSIWILISIITISKFQADLEKEWDGR